MALVFSYLLVCLFGTPQLGVSYDIRVLTMWWEPLRHTIGAQTKCIKRPLSLTFPILEGMSSTDPAPPQIWEGHREQAVMLSSVTFPLEVPKFSGSQVFPRVHTPPPPQMAMLSSSPEGKSHPSSITHSFPPPASCWLGCQKLLIQGPKQV